MAIKKLKLIDNWKQAHKFASMKFSALGFLLSAADFCIQIWNVIPGSMMDRIPYAPLISMGLFILVIIGRIFKLTSDEE